jgi:stage III sporulation protein AE
MKTNSFFRAVLFLISLGLLLICFALPCFAKEDDETTVPNEFHELLDVLPDELQSLLPDGLFGKDLGQLGEAVNEMSDFSSLLQALLSLLGVRLDACLRLLASILGMLLLAGILRAVSASLSAKHILRAFSLCTTLVLLGFLLTRGYSSIRATSEYFDNLGKMSGASIPLLGALYAMGGNVSAAAAASAGLTAFMSVLEGMVGKTIVPFCGICLAFSAMSAMDPSLRLGALIDTVKKHYTTALTFLMMLLLTMVSAQTLLGAKSDTIAMKSVKFAAGNLIPVVGGSIAELLRTVSAGVGYLRGAVGICAVLLLLLMLLPTLVELLLVRLCWQICAALADMLGCDSEKRLLEEFASVHGYLIAAVCICSSVLFLSFTLLAHCAAAVG